jgi:hypothetical protein
MAPSRRALQQHETSPKVKKENLVNKKLLAIAMALPLLMTAAASAQTVHMRVIVPFNFVAAGAATPAGEYDIR